MRFRWVLIEFMGRFRALQIWFLTILTQCSPQRSYSLTKQQKLFINFCLINRISQQPKFEANQRRKLKFLIKNHSKIKVEGWNLINHGQHPNYNPNWPHKNVKLFPIIRILTHNPFWILSIIVNTILQKPVKSAR